MLAEISQATSRWLLQRRLSDIAKREETIKGRLGKEVRGAQQSFEMQELRSELHQLARWRDDTERKLGAIDTSPKPKKDADRQKVLDVFEAETRKQLEHFIGKLEREGDFRQARIHRESLLTLRERIEHEFG